MTEATGAQQGAGEGAAASGADAQAAGAAQNETILANGGAAAEGPAQGAQGEQGQSQGDGRQRGPDGKFLPKADWRDRLAGDDAQFRKRLDRFTDETAFAKSYRALEQKPSSGEMKRALPENATEDDVKAWRKENGIPDMPDAYVESLKLPNGIVPGETDKPLLNGFAKHAMERNWTPRSNTTTRCIGITTTSTSSAPRKNRLMSSIASGLRTICVRSGRGRTTAAT